ncbi:hypothetical protein F2Q69_00057624 [Brassica cretica]|uniref:Uncharacterized protein n=1 Tax=Brassica cretica TaxID=69181 RepID=A0A8S9MT81_BRACR|nr:hypothetical protein F2Q69_00057624 [Brassica cretica]
MENNNNNNNNRISIPVTLKGINYLLWARMVKIALGGKEQRNREAERIVGPLSIAVPGEIAGLYKAWETHGRVPRKLLVEPSIKLARDGFQVGSHLDFALSKNEAMIKNDNGLKSVFTKEGELLKKGDICYNTKLADTLESVAEKGMKAFYEEDVAEKLVNDVREAGGIITMDDLESYEV